VTLKGQTGDPNTLRAQYLETSWICYLATIANYYLICCETVRSAILATAWLLVGYFICKYMYKIIRLVTSDSTQLEDSVVVVLRDCNCPVKSKGECCEVSETKTSSSKYKQLRLRNYHKSGQRINYVQVRNWIHFY